MRCVLAGVIAVLLSVGPAAAQEGPWVISPEGVRGVRIGMTEAEALEVLNRGIAPDAFSRWVAFGDNLDDPQSCRGLGVQSDGEGEYGALTFMVEGGRVTRYSVLAQDPAAASYATDRGVGSASTEAEVRRAYPGAIVSQASYAGRPMSVHTVWTQGRPAAGAPAADARGLSFVLEEGRMWEIHAGGPSIRRIEGCS